MSPTDIVGTFNAVSTAVTSLFQIVKAANSLEANQRLIELQNLLLQLQQDSMASVNRIAELEGELQQMREAGRIEEELTKVGDTLWRRVGEVWKGPYCPVCWGSDQKLVYAIGGGTPDAQGRCFWQCRIHSKGLLRVSIAELEPLGIR